ncbi:hypothetical protein V2J09_022687 [Rumex salicifolius]
MGFSKKRALIFSLLFITTGLLLLLSTTLQPGPLPPLVHHHSHVMPQRVEAAATLANEYPKWYDVVLRQTGRRRLKVGLVNTELQLPEELAELVRVEFDRVDPGVTWAHIFPEWIDERKPKCPEIPMPEFRGFRGLDVVVATVPCGSGNGTEGARDVFRLQANLVAAKLAAGSRDEGPGQPVYVVFLGGCEPMWEIFRCDDLIWKKGEAMVYRPNVAKLKHKVMMPVGTCDLARPWNNDILHQSAAATATATSRKEAYVTMLHSSEHYVCGAIALAQSILQTNTTKDLVLLADASISARSIQGLSDAGWKIKRIKRIRSPNAKPDAYNEWNYSKLRVWQLTDYDKVMFIDADFILLHNLDRFFSYPQLSAAANNHHIFNSGIMIVEPSQCFFDRMMRDRHSILSYNGGDQGFLNELFTWWHRLTIKLNYLKIFMKPTDSREVPNDRLTIHFLGMKPWVCYKDYDCNWDISSRHIFASDSAHRRWWKVYEAMPKRLQPFCAMTQKMDARIRKWREKATKDKYANGRWKIAVKDPRQHRLTRR